MALNKALVTCFVLASSAGIATAQQSLPSADELTDGIRAFMCDLEDAGQTPVILVHDANKWHIIDNQLIDDVAEISTGFRFKSSTDGAFLGILQTVSGRWTLRLLDEYQSSSSDCQSMDGFTEQLTSAVAPKLYSNADSLASELHKTKEQLRETKAHADAAKSKIDNLEANIRELTDESAELSRRYSDLWGNVTNGYVAGTYNFISEALNIKDVTNRIAFVEAKGLDNTIGLTKHCTNKLMNQPTKFGLTCWDRLLTYMIKEVDIKSVPLTGEEKTALRVAVQQCWNVGSLSAEALQTVIVVAFEMNEQARPVTSSIRMLSSSGGSDLAANQAFEATRRAIIRCGVRGYDLPEDKYDRWRYIELTFDPKRMRIK